jgi:hypothetical protein
MVIDGDLFVLGMMNVQILLLIINYVLNIMQYEEIKLHLHERKNH